MNELWAIVVALPHERQAVLPQMSVRARIRGLGFKIWEGEIAQRKVLLVQSGLGITSAKIAGNFLVEHFPITHLIATGYCGALHKNLKTGDAVWADSLRSESDESFLLSEESALKNVVEKSFKICSQDYQRGTLITRQNAVNRSKDKKSLAESTGAIAVDMETYPLFQSIQTSGKKIAFLSLRFVLDAADDELAPTDDFVGQNGHVKPLNLVKQVIKRPPLILELQGMGHKASRAREALSRWVGCFFKNL